MQANMEAVVTIDQAVDSFQRGDLRRAEEVCNAILAGQPNHPDAFHIKGVIAYQVGRHREAVAWIHRAIQLNGSNEDYYFNLGNVFRKLGDGTTAVTCYREALHLNPNMPHALNNLGRVLKKMGMRREAEGCFQHILERQPHDYRALMNLSEMVGDVRIDPSCDVSPLAKIETAEAESIRIGKNSKVGDYVQIQSCGGNIEIGHDCSIQLFCVLYGHGGLSIGNHVIVAAQTIIVPSNHNFQRRDVPIAKQGETSKGITIGDDVWIGAGCKILDGVTIGCGCVVGAGSVVTRSIPDDTVAAGVPAKVLRKR